MRSRISSPVSPFADEYKIPENLQKVSGVVA
jgi:hypothetical protein